ncbi:MAG: hypothetical protein B6244_08970 [Candidatus Cloacimonetes bacterium 4572_55]|nr:MAG: hypothetical protein B6244_08970 [Candidatus Cloacimonetes bacterium 4572_55]
MQTLVISDKFKGSMTSAEAGNAIKQGILGVRPDTKVIALPIADGGEGTVESLVAGCGGDFHEIEVTGPLGRPTLARFGTLDNGSGIVETAAAIGLDLVPTDRRQPLTAMSHGAGQLIHACLDKGCRKIFVGLGGSATVDLGIGMTSALGGRFLDAQGRRIPEIGRELYRLAHIDLSRLDPRLSHKKNVTIIGLYDVTHTLLSGVLTFAPQKGANENDLKLLRRNTIHAATIIRDFYPDVEMIVGGGAAGGLGAGLVSFLNGSLVPGAKTIFDLINLREQIRHADLIITGEGSIDMTSVSGKAISGLMDLVREQPRSIPIIGFAGSFQPDAVQTLGLDAAYAIAPPSMSITDAKDRGAELLQAAVSNLFTIQYPFRGKR